MAISNLDRLLLIIIAFLPVACVKCQLPEGCDLQETIMDLGLSCFNQGPSEESSSIRAEACCLALNRALKGGNRCLCSVLASTLTLASTINIPLSAPIFPGCYVSFPTSMADCGVAAETNALPVTTKQPVISPLAIAPAPKKLDSSTNSSQAQTETKKSDILVKEMERANKMGSQRDQTVNSNSRRKMCDSTRSLVWMTAIYAWLVV